MGLKHYSPATKEKAFRFYRQYEGSFTKVSKALGGRPTKGAIMQWAEEDDWDGKILESKNVVRKMLGVNNDPLVKALAKDDVFVVEVLSLLQGIALKSLKGKRKSKMYPRSSSELVRLLDFVSKEYRLRAGSSENPAQAHQGKVGKATLREIIAAELGGGDEANEAARGLIVNLRDELRRIRKKRLKMTTEAIEKEG